MPTTTRYFGLILIVLGVASYILTGRTSVTALIPALSSARCSSSARWSRGNESARKHAMHAAVAVGLLGALAALAAAFRRLSNGDATRPAVLSQLLMGVLLLVYVAARRAVVHRGPQSPTGQIATETRSTKHSSSLGSEVSVFRALSFVSKGMSFAAD